MNKQYYNLLKKGAFDFGVDLSEEQISLLLLFLEGLWSWNRIINLSGILEKRDMVIQLLLDSLVAVPYLPLKGKLLDVGSGAGIPGVPIKIARPEFSVDLLESRAKKVSFLKEMIRKTGLKGITAHNGRAEKSNQLAGLFKSYNIVTARALSSLKKTISICSSYLSPYSLLVTFKGPRIDREVEESRMIMETLRLSIETKIGYKLPETDGMRYLVILKKG